MNIFYTPGLAGDVYQLNEEESNHIIRVLRFKRGDYVFLTDGTGNFFEAEITNDNPKGCQLKITETKHEYGKRNYQLHIGIAPTKNIDRFEWFLEKATEIGIDEITPLICDHSERREVKTERLNKVIVAAMKQSVKAYLPKLNPGMSFKEFVSKSFNGLKFICTVPKTSSGNNLLQNLYKREKDSLILIGPEGDFSEEEIQLSVKNNFVVARLGESRLRTETAGIVACHTISIMNQ